MGRYDDLLELPHPQSATRPHMRLEDRAAQFAPFAVLTGLDQVLREAERQSAEHAERTEYPDPADPAEQTDGTEAAD